ncbi:MAG: AraC family transcriptional regulator ligand-binding domain-containing protein [Thermodesulfobacteriota bacterium]
MTGALDRAATAQAALAGAATIPVRYAREAVARLPIGAAARARILREAGVPPSRLRDPGHRLTGEQFAAVYRDAVRAGGDESLGYSARPVPLGGYAFLVGTLVYCGDVAACLERANAFYRLFDPRGGWELAVERGQATLRLRPASRAQAGSVLTTHTMLLTPTRTAEWLVGQPLPLLGLTLPTRFRPLAAETRFLFGVPPQLAGDAEIRFDTRQLALPVVRRPADVPGYLRAALQGFLLGPPGDRVEHAVRTALATWQPFAGASVDQVARKLAMSRPTLARHLQRIGTSFAALREELRRDLAIALLGRGVRIPDVAERLGYSEPSAFQRAFKTWTGTSPGRYVADRRHAR